MSTRGLTPECQSRLRWLSDQFGRIVDQVCESDCSGEGSPELARALGIAGELLCQAGQELIKASAKGQTASDTDRRARNQAVVRAANQYDYAVRCLKPIKGKDRMTTKAAYEFLKDAYDKWRDNMTEEYGPLPAFSTWTRYLRFHKAIGQRKNKRRTGLSVASHSQVRSSEVEMGRTGELGDADAA